MRITPARLAALALLLLAVALYVSPLRAFFAAQTVYFQQRAVLTRAEASGRTLRRELAQLHDPVYLSRLAREDYQLVPAGLQAFVVKGLPAATAAIPASAGSGRLRISWDARLRDLLQTLER